MTRRLNSIGCVLILLSVFALQGGCGGGGGGGKPKSDGGKATGGDKKTDAGGAAVEDNGKTPPDETNGTGSGAGSAGETGWAHLKVRFLYDADAAPEPAKLTLTQDKEYCGKNHPVDERLVVNKENLGIADVLVWMYVRSGDDPPKAHPSYEATASAEVVLDNKLCRFEPHVSLLRAGQKLVIKNSDPFSHNTNVQFLDNPAFNQSLPAGESMSKDVSLGESRPAQVNCNVHPWMSAWVLVQDHPYMGKSDADGNLAIENVPTGEWTFRFYHTQSGYLADVQMTGGKTDARGLAKLQVKSGANDLGTVKLKPSAFAEN